MNGMQPPFLDPDVTRRLQAVAATLDLCNRAVPDDGTVSAARGFVGSYRGDPSYCSCGNMLTIESRSGRCLECRISK